MEFDDAFHMRLLDVGKRNIATRAIDIEQHAFGFGVKARERARKTASAFNGAIRDHVGFIASEMLEMLGRAQRTINAGRADL